MPKRVRPLLSQSDPVLYEAFANAWNIIMHEFTTKEAEEERDMHVRAGAASGATSSPTSASALASSSQQSGANQVGVRGEDKQQSSPFKLGPLRSDFWATIDRRRGTAPRQHSCCSGLPPAHPRTST
jgi:hypothetical protein